ncbi:MAG: carboxypeptidase regulatory-like domain-containing protein, partial [Gammaproteobacteria bacterium]
LEIRRDNDLILEAYTGGPYLLVQLPPGDYEVTATHLGVPKTQAIKVDTRPRRIGWTWPAPKDEVDPNQQSPAPIAQ